MDVSFLRRLGAVALAAGVAAALTLPSSASGATPWAAPDSSPSADFDASPYVTPDMLAAMERDLGLSAEEALDRLAADAAASSTEQELQESLDSSFGGAWIDADQQLVVGITDPDQASEVVAAGATPLVVTYNQAALDGAMAGLDAAAAGIGASSDAPDPAEIYGWHVDVTTNSVVVQASPDGVAAADEFVEASGVDAAMVRVEVSTETPSIFPDIIGGHPYYPGNSRCSIGFSVQPRGFVTAGHCGGVGTTTRGHNQQAQGTVQRSNFPGRDMAYVAVNTSWVPQPYVWRYSGSQVFLVSGSQVAAIGAATCRSGSTTGWRCGSITHRNQTVNYPQGSVSGLTRTTACAQGGDSGGSFVAANGQAQGVTSGGSGNCSIGGITFFQPVNPILSSYGLSLVTG